MKKSILTLATLILSLGLSTATFANTKTPVINWRQHNQQERIAQGVRSGELTPKETLQLERREAKIQHDKMGAKEDGNMSPLERARINRELNKESRIIYRDKHNGHETGWAK